MTTTHANFQPPILYRVMDNVYALIGRSWNNTGLESEQPCTVQRFQDSVMYSIIERVSESLFHGDKWFLLENSKSFNLIGITFEHNLNWRKHVP